MCSRNIFYLLIPAGNFNTLAIMMLLIEGYLQLFETSKIERFVKLVNGF